MQLVRSDHSGSLTTDAGCIFPERHQSMLDEFCSRNGPDSEESLWQYRNASDIGVGFTSEPHFLPLPYALGAVSAAPHPRASPLFSLPEVPPTSHVLSRLRLVHLFH